MKQQQATRVALTVLLVAATSVVGSTNAFARGSLVPPQPCPQRFAASIPQNVSESNADYPISVSNTRSSLIGYVQNGARVVGEPGMTIEISRTIGTTFTVGVSASATVEADMVFAKASATAGFTLTNSWSSTTEYRGSWVIPNNGRRGWISIGSDKYRVTGTVHYVTQRCAYYTRTKTYDAISNDVSFRHGQF